MQYITVKTENNETGKTDQDETLSIENDIDLKLQFLCTSYVRNRIWNTVKLPVHL